VAAARIRAGERRYDAGMMTERRPPAPWGAPRHRWLAALLATLALGIGGLWLAVGGQRAARLPHEPAEIDTAHYLRPIETAADPRTGEETAPFSGFAVAVETEPADAVVTVAGVERGEAPVLAGVDCRPGTKVPIRVEKAGFRASRATTICRADTLVKLTVRLAE
jgi:hypothetical protein